MCRRPSDKSQPRVVLSVPVASSPWLKGAAEFSKRRATKPNGVPGKATGTGCQSQEIRNQ